MKCVTIGQKECHSINEIREVLKEDSKALFLLISFDYNTGEKLSDMLFPSIETYIEDWSSLLWGAKNSVGSVGMPDKFQGYIR